MTVHRRRLVPCAFAAIACALPAAAGAAGPPLPSSESGKLGAVAPGGSERLLTRRAGADTAVLAVRRGGHRVLRSSRISGRWAIAAVTLDNGTTGLSADGGTLLLARPVRNFPPASTQLAVVDARRLTVRRRIALQGFFTVDAISPDGRWAYLVQYAGNDPFDYRVRALDTSTGKLAAQPVVDKRKPDEQMGGLAMTRATSRDGRWFYTLYSGGRETFIHALDTVDRTAACIDLDMLSPESDLSDVRLVVSADGRRLDVRRGGGVVASVDARTFAVSEPGAKAAPAPARATAAPQRAVAEADAGFPWPVLLLVGGVAGAGALAVAAVRRRAG